MWGLDSVEEKGPRHASCLWSQRAGDPTWEPSRLSRPERVGPVPSALLLLLRSWRAPPACLSCSPLASLLWPQDLCGRGWWGVVPWRVGDPAWELSRIPGVEWVGQTSSSPLPLLRSQRRAFLIYFNVVVAFNYFILFYLFYFWLRWVFVAARGLSVVVASGGYSSLRCAGFSLRWLLLLWSTGSRRAGFRSCGMQAQ